MTICIYDDGNVCWCSIVEIFCVLKKWHEKKVAAGVDEMTAQNLEKC